MEIPVNYEGNALMQIIRIYEPYYTNDTLNELSNKKTIIRKVSNYGFDNVFLQLQNVNLHIAYCKNEQIYESINMDLDYVYLIKIIKLC
jgi:hypothetical protein